MRFAATKCFQRVRLILIHLSNFYSFGLNRNSIATVKIYDFDDKSNETSYQLEFLGEQLWILYDG